MFTVNTTHSSRRYLFNKKHGRVAGTEFQTPAKALPAGKPRKTKDQPHPDARGVNEIYQQINDEGDLRKARRSRQNPIQESIKDDLEKVHEDELTTVFLSLQFTEELSDADIKFLSDILQSTSDFQTVPLMPETVDALNQDEGINARDFQQFKETVEAFVDTEQNRANPKPVLGVLPDLPWEFTNELVELYLRKGVRAFCFNFNGNKPTAANRITSMMQPLFRELGTRGLHEEVLLYAINAKTGREDSSLGATPPSDFASLGIGFDILGENHTGLQLPEEDIEELKEKWASQPTTFETFNRGRYTYEETLLDNLEANFPLKTGLNCDRIKYRVNSNEGERYRYQAILNAEQLSFAAQELREAIESGTVEDLVRGKQGFTPQLQGRMQDVQESFEEGDSQSSLGEF